MALIRFYPHSKSEDGTYSIRLTYRCQDGRYFKEPMKDDCRAKLGKGGTWKKAAQRFIPSARNSGALNNYLDEWEKRVYAIVKEIRLTAEMVTPESIRARLQGEKQTFWEFFDWLIENPPADWGSATLKSYKKQKALFRRFEKKNYAITFSGINQQFADDLTNFMRTESRGKEKKTGKELYYNDSTIKNTFRRISGITTYAVKYGVIKSKEKITSPAKAMDSGAVYLSKEEIEKLYEKVKEPIIGEGIPDEINLYGKIFVLGTQLGLRVSDMKIKPGNFIDGKKKVSAGNKKTTSEVIIPLTKIARELFKEFDYEIPPFSEVLMNRYIKILCEISGINDVVVHRTVVGGKMTEETFYKYEKIASHTMRRSFATNMFLAGVPALVIMKITGHKTETDFMRYIRISNQEAAEIMAKHLGM